MELPTLLDETFGDLYDSVRDRVRSALPETAGREDEE